MDNVSTPVVTVRDLLENFNFEIVEGSEKALNRTINIADTNRPGLELSGFYNYSQLKRLVILGDKEMAYISTMSDEAKRQSFDFLTSDQTPGLIISKNHDCPPLLKEIAVKKDFPILRSSNQTYRLIVDVVTYLDEKLASFINIHGVLLSIYGKGVMICGKSGMGKSEIALELIKRGHLLVADDRVDCYRIHNKIVGKAPEILKEMLELRGIGIINVSRMFGASSVLDRVELSLVVELQQWDAANDYDRVGIEEKQYDRILGVDVPKIVLPVKEGRSMAVIIESAVTNFTLSQMGLDSAKEFEHRVLEYINKNSQK